MPRGVTIYVASVVLAAVLMAGIMQWTVDGPASTNWLAVLAFFGLAIAAEWMDVRFRFHGQVEALNLSEAVLAPLIFAFGGPLVMGVIAAGQLTAGLIRRNEPIKTAFNAGQWALAAGFGCLVLQAMRAGEAVTGPNMGALLLAMVVIGMVNQLAMTVVLRLAQRRPLRSVLMGLSPVIVPGWVVGWGLNTLVGFLFVLAFESSPVAVLLFFVPLGVLHAAYRGYAGTESDRMRLAGLHRASRLLAAPGEPDHAVSDFLAEVCRCFEAAGAELLLVRTDGIVIHRVRRGDADTYVKELDDAGHNGLRSGLVARAATSRISVESTDELAPALEGAGWRDCLMAPLPSDNLMPGVLAVYDQNGLEGFEEGERAVLEALARETASSFEKGKLFAAIVEERHKLSQIVDSTFDGVLTLTAEGVVRTWNPGWEQITGHSASLAVGRMVTESVSMFDLDGRPVPLHRWTSMGDHLPAEVQLIDSDGAVHWLQCQYRSETDDNGLAKVLTVVAHDTSDVRQIEQLREDVDRLAELEALQRARVLQLQDSLQPSVPVAGESEFGVHYLPSDTNAPTGGDFYDWQVLPDGNVHIAVVDVLGHGVEATNDALTVIHTLRMLAFQGVPVDELVHRADALLSALNPDLVATAIAVRYQPTTGRARLAGGGHPPPLLVMASGSVEEVAAPGIAIGWPGAGSDRAVDVVLGPSDTLVLYTDGLVEARRDILLGLEALAETAGQIRDLPAPEMARTLVERSLEGADRRDDSLALVIRHCDPVRSSTSVAPYAFRHRGAPAPEQVPMIRHQFGAWLRMRTDSDESVDDLVVVLSELVTNAVRAAARFYEVRAEVDGSMLVVEVEDDGPGFADDNVIGSEPDFEGESGRGLYIVRSLVDSLEVQTPLDGQGCVVRLVKTVLLSERGEGAARRGGRMTATPVRRQLAAAEGGAAGADEPGDEQVRV